MNDAIERNILDASVSNLTVVKEEKPSGIHIGCEEVSFIVINVNFMIVKRDLISA